MILPARHRHSLGSHEDERRLYASCSEQQQKSCSRSAGSISTGRNHSVAAANLRVDLRGPTGESPLTYDRYSRFLFSGVDDLHCKRADSDANQPMDHPSVSSRTLCLSGAAHLRVPDDHIHFCDMDHFLPELIHKDAVMLSEAKHLCYLPVRNWWANDQRWKAWPRGLRPLRCSFASLRMTPECL